jgi:peptidoglycan/xylan/chitin deacetylase (PgdA/CDA1 family)
MCSWSHADLTTLTTDGITSQMTQLESALISIVGFFPQYMRPPYYAYNAQVLQTLGSLGYHVITSDIDTLDWLNNSPSSIGQSVTIFQNGLNSGGTLSLAHDTSQNTVNTLAQAMINAVKAKGLRGKQILFLEETRADL